MRRSTVVGRGKPFREIRSNVDGSPGEIDDRFDTLRQEEGGGVETSIVSVVRRDRGKVECGALVEDLVSDT